MQKRAKTILFFIVAITLLICPAYAEADSPPFKTVGKASYNFQKYTGFNFLSRLIGKSIIKRVVKKETNARRVKVDLDIYSGWDLIHKKVKSLEVDAEDLLVEGIPFNYLNVESNTPIYVKKYENQFNRTIYGVSSPVELVAKVESDLNEATNVLNKLPKWRSLFDAIDVPLPPIGTTTIAVSDFDLMIDNNGYANVSAKVRSVKAPDSEPIDVRFFGKIVLEDRKLLIRNVESEVVDLFARDSDVSIAFNEILEELINPVVNFNKFEDNRFKIKDVDLKFNDGKVILGFDLKINPPERLI